MDNSRYKFRGKRIDNGEWVYGYLVKSVNDRTYIIKYSTEDTVNTKNEIDFIYIEVIPETVGQHIGLKDKNIKEIYEDDLVKYDDKILIVKWENGRYFFNPIKEKDMLNWQLLDVWNVIYYKLWEHMEVIGNKFENPVIIDEPGY